MKEMIIQAVKEACRFLYLQVFPDVIVGTVAATTLKTHWHGTFSIQSLAGPAHAPFVVSNLERVRRPTKEVIESLFAQGEQLGYYAETLELLTHGQKRVYRRGSTKPILQQAFC